MIINSSYCWWNYILKTILNKLNYYIVLTLISEDEFHITFTQRLASLGNSED